MQGSGACWQVKKLDRKATGESGGIQAPGACGPGLQGARGPGPQGLGPGPGAFSHPNLSNYKPPGRSLAKAWVSAETAASEVGTWRETKPGYPPYAPPLPHILGLQGRKEEGFQPLRLRQPSNTPRTLNPKT